jgi:hypothetical protein
MKPIPIERIIGEQLSSVEFVQDYVQLKFDGPTLTVFTWPVLRIATMTVHSRDAGYKDHLCERIGHKVSAAAIRDENSINITFDDGAEVSISLKPQDRQGPEAGYFAASGDPKEPLLDF